MFKLFLLCVLMIFTSCSSRRDNQDIQERPREIPALVPTPSPTPQPEPPPRKVYIALGDSVSEGFGIWSAADRHTSVFFEKLRAQGFVNDYVNLAVSGYTTADLLSRLKTLNPNEYEAFRHARVITLNIGGNNILAPLWEYLPDAGEVQDIITETTTFATEAWELMQEILEFVGESREAITDVLDFANEVVYFAENFGVRDIFRLNEMIAAAPPVIDGAMEVFAEVEAMEITVSDMFSRTEDLQIFDLIALLSGDFSFALQRDLHASVRIFTGEFIEILEWLQTHAPDAVIIVNTVYNPLPHDLMGLPLGLSDEAERFIQDLNHVIHMEAQSRGFIVSDIYTSLSNRPDMMNANFDLIHPNPRGHQEIAQINFSDFMRILYQTEGGDKH